MPPSRERGKRCDLAGLEHGESRGSRVIDGNTSEETCRKIIKGYDEGDPEVMDLCPSPLSGEWAGESMSELSDEYGINLDDEQQADDFETGFADGFWAEVLKSAKYQTA